MTRLQRGVSARRSKTQRFSVFDFNEEEESCEKSSKEFVKKLEENERRSRKRDRPSPSPVNKYKFLEFFTGGTGGVIENDRARCDDVKNAVIDVDSGNDDNEESKSFHKVTKGRTEFDATGGIALGYDFQASSALPNSKNNLFSEDLTELVSLSPILSNSTNREKQPVEMVSSIVKDKINNSLKPMLDDVSVLNEIDYLTSTVVLSPDFIRYEDKYCTESRLIFTKSHIKIEGSAVNGVNGTFNAKWDVPDITDIKAKWSAKVESALVVIHLKFKVSGVKDDFGISGTDRLEFSVFDPCWYELREAIKSLDAKYHATWNEIFDVDEDSNEVGFAGLNSIPDWSPSIYAQEKTFRDLTYPQGDTDPVIIGSRELELLLPGKFVNDTIIDFYIKYLQSKIQVEDQQRFHFFNSFFFRKLFDLDKKPLSAKEGKAAFQRVRNWTRAVNLFEKEYIFIPINYSNHWSLIIICHPGKVARLREGEGQIFPNVPCIIHMDSIKGFHSDLNNLFQSYLCEEWRDRHTQSAKKKCLRFLDLQFITPELPRQMNHFDCGLFLLHYAELFLEAILSVRLDERNLSTFSNIKSSNFLNSNWFFPAEASLKRVHIRKLIYEIAEQYQNSSSNSTDNDVSSLDEDMMEEIGNDLSSETSTSSSKRSSEIGVVGCDPDIDDYVIFLKEIDKQDSPAASSNVIECVENSQETCQQRADSGFSPEIPIGPFLKSLEIEVVNIDDDDQDYQKEVDKPDFPVVSRNIIDCVVEDSQESCQDRVYSSFNPSTSSAFPPKSLEIEVVDVDEDHDHDHDDDGPKCEADKQDVPSSSNNLMDCVVKDSQEEECTLNTYTLPDPFYEFFEHNGAQPDSEVGERLGNRGVAGHSPDIYSRGSRSDQASFVKGSRRANHISETQDNELNFEF